MPGGLSYDSSYWTSAEAQHPSVEFNPWTGALSLEYSWGSAIFSAVPLTARARRGLGPYRPCIPYLDVNIPALVVDPETEFMMVVPKIIPEPDARDALRGTDPQMLFSFDRKTPGQTARAWLDMLPQPAVSAVGRYTPSPWNWHLLRSFTRLPSLAELAEHNPALAWAAGSRALHRGPDLGLSDLKRLFLPGRGQMELLAWCGFPATDLVRKLLAKVPAEEVSLPLLGRLRKALAAASLREPEFLRRWLSHVPRVTEPLVDLLHPRYRDMITPKLLLETAATGMKNGPSPARLLDELIGLLGPREGRTGAPPRFNSLRRLEEAVAALEERIQFEGNANSRPIPLSATFAPPPAALPNNEHLAYIADAKSLRRLALSLKCCLWTPDWSLPILRGEAWAWALNYKGERGAIVISRREDGELTLAAAGFQNGDLSPAACDFVKSHFDGLLSGAAALSEVFA